MPCGQLGCLQPAVLYRRPWSLLVESWRRMFAWMEAYMHSLPLQATLQRNVKSPTKAGHSVEQLLPSLRVPGTAQDEI